MSRESYEWLNRNVLVGMTDKRGTAWHYRKSDQGDEPNHYPGAIPVADVIRRLFSFQVEATPSAALIPIGAAAKAARRPGAGFPEGPTVTIDGVLYAVQVVDRDRYWMADDDWSNLGHHTTAYAGHQYQQWCIDNVATLLDGDLGIGSAGLLANRGRAWVQVELPENIEVEGFAFSPYLLAATSFDGSLASRLRLCMGVAVCDNTLDVALAEHMPEVKVRHSKYSALKVAEAREALGLIYTAADAMSEAIRDLIEWQVTADQFEAIVCTVVPDPPPEATKTAQTLAANKRAAVRRIALTDERANPWWGTALGTVAAFNTYGQHEATIRGANARAERNMAKVLAGTLAKDDAEVLSAIAKVTGRTDRLHALAGALGVTER